MQTWACSNLWRDWERYSDGWLVYLTDSNFPYKRDSGLTPDPITITLTIGGFHIQGIVEVDILSVIKEVNPELYQDWNDHGSLGMDSDRVDVERLHLHVEHGLVVVGLKATQRHLSPTPIPLVGGT